MQSLRKAAFPVELLALVFLTSACGQPQASLQLPKRIVDLSPTISEDLPVRTVGSKFLTGFLTAEQKRDIFYHNAARFLRLDQEEQ
jgi:hypothetical protein